MTLKKRREILRAEREGRRVVSPYLVMLCAPGTEEVSRFVFKCSRRLGKAVVRNRIRRRLKELSRRHLARWRTRRGESLDVVVIPRVAIVDREFDEIEQDYVRLMDRAVRSMARSRAPGPSRAPDPSRKRVARNRIARKRAPGS